MVGLDLRRAWPAGKPGRSIGGMEDFLWDLRARGWQPRGIVDIGANRGPWTRTARRVFSDCPVIMVEPQRELEPDLRAVENEFPGVSHVLAVVGAAPGQQVLTIWDDLAGSSCLPSTDETLLSQGRQRTVDVVTLPGLVASSKSPFAPDLIKVDVQGFEMEVLKGAGNVLGQAEIIIIEVSLFRFGAGMPLAREIIEYLGAHGYELYDVAGFLRRPLDGALAQLDLVFARAGGFLRPNNGWDK